MTTPVIIDEKFELDSPSLRNEKKDYIDEDNNSQVIIDEQPHLERLTEEFQFTWRSAIVGSLLGCLVGTIKKLIKYPS
jgi:hypothetical protein